MPCRNGNDRYGSGSILGTEPARAARSACVAAAAQHHPNGGGHGDDAARRQQDAAAPARAVFGSAVRAQRQAMQPTAKALDIADRLRGLLAAADGLRFAATEFDPASSDPLFSLLF